MSERAHQNDRSDEGEVLRSDPLVGWLRRDTVRGRGGGGVLGVEHVSSVLARYFTHCARYHVLDLASLPPAVIVGLHVGYLENLAELEAQSCL